jgi:hypothetical protein
MISAEEIMITASEKISHVIFDGKWTTELEWKPSSFNEIRQPQVAIRSAHHDEFIYLMIDVLQDRTLDLHSDRAMVCFDTLNDKSKIPNEDDYCFSVTTGSQNGVTINGGGISINKSFFKKIVNNNDFIAVGAISDENDRYEKIPHSSYEFKIPLEVIGRSDNYGFLVYITDTNRDHPIMWPEGITVEKPNRIPSPSEWGNLVSPDKSLPEFGMPLMIIVFSIVLISMFTKLRKSNLYILK